jgi:shikimate dehydrogenase
MLVSLSSIEQDTGTGGTMTSGRSAVGLPPQKQMTGMLGHPVAENPIDRMFDAVYEHHGLPWQFWKCDVAAHDLGAAIAGTKALGFRGYGITVPYKIASTPFLDAIDEDVRTIGAVNYVTVEDGRLVGHNNDGKGVVKAILKVTPIAGKRVVVLGAGGAGRAMAVELGWAGVSHLTVVTRREEQGREVADLVHRAADIPTDWQAWEGTVTIPPGTDIVMNATTLGSAPAVAPVPLEWEDVGADMTAVDVITNPRLTPFLATAKERGCALVDGVEMLVQLAMGLFESWTRVTPEEDVFQRAVSAALGE